MAPPSVAPGSKLAEKPVANSSKTIAKKQKKTSYKSDGVKDNDVFLLPGTDYQIVVALTILAAIVRLFRIYQPSSVVFDEVHFGGFASKYIKGKFFMDVHPPLAKMLIALTGWLAGFDGNFDFKEIGKDYVEPGVPYVAMRMFPAICGILLAPAMFLTLKATGCRTTTATMGSALIIFENGLLTQARLILLDSPLMVATAFTALAFTSFTNQHELGPEKAFDLSWWFWLVMTGLGLGTTLSIKWVGLFTIAWVGSLTLVQLWVLLGDTKTVTLTRTRVVDENGNEVQVPGEEAGVVAPPHPDVEGVDPETKQKVADADSKVPEAAESVKGEREAEQKKPKPASEGGKEATVKEEL
ncbi:hypothetical protein BN1723_011278 [Verticillium longisporum]|uniref:ArnT-like N-terminal domain-containing protein n=1 Tax=Verticillium longisporum TaxID=100787 RepID=A0A0G4L607_VERLO|nr:hypothetical protein BN1723_011278 [Verticillium longisporum]